MIRWKYVTTRLLLVIVVLAFVCFGIDPLLRWSIVRFGEQTIGAKVELSDVRVSLAHTKVKLSGLQVANPKSPLENLFQIQNLILDFDSKAVLQREIVVEQARIHGLEIQAPRDESGEIPVRLEAEGEKSSEPGFNAKQFGEQWLRNMGEVAEERLRRDLKSIPLAEELHVRWTDKYRVMEGRVEAVELRIRELRDLYRNVNRKDPLKIAEAVAQANQQAFALRQEMNLLRDEIERIQVDANRDAAAIEVARQHDLEYLRNTVQVESFKSGQLAEYLLEEEMQERLKLVMGWVGRCRSVIAATSEPKPPRGKGIDILFSQRQERPAFLIKRLSVDGFADIDAKRVPFVAEAHSVTSHPRLVGQPTQVRISTQGAIPAVVDAVFDHTSEHPVQHYTVDIPRLAIPARNWGKPDRFALAVAKAHARIWCELETCEGQIQGRVIFMQDELELQPQSGKLDARMEAQLRDALSGVSKLHAVADVSGSLLRPGWRLKSNLGPQIAGALNQTMSAELAYRKQQVAGKLDDSLQREVAKFSSMVETKKQELLGKLDLNNTQINEFKNVIAEMANLSKFGLPNSVPLERLFRR